jgi:hypothetical protein
VGWACAWVLRLFSGRPEKPRPHWLAIDETWIEDTP